MQSGESLMRPFPPVLHWLICWQQVVRSKRIPHRKNQDVCMHAVCVCVSCDGLVGTQMDSCHNVWWCMVSPVHLCEHPRLVSLISCSDGPSSGASLVAWMTLTVLALGELPLFKDWSSCFITCSRFSLCSPNQIRFNTLGKKVGWFWLLISFIKARAVKLRRNYCFPRRYYYYSERPMLRKYWVKTHEIWHGGGNWVLRGIWSRGVA